MSLTQGTRLGPYELQTLVGAGGGGGGYRARDTRLDRTVAIKVLSSHGADAERLRQRFDREARAVSRLNHPNICTLHDIGRERDVDFLVMEYVEGDTLAARLQRAPLSVAEAIRVATQIADALARAHAAGVIHRDLKPSNVMLTKSGVKLLDFGIAKLISTDDDAATRPELLTTEGAVLGTVQYMAPEQLEGKTLDARTDIFAFGAVVYEMITGRRAFAADNSAGVIAAILNTTPPSPASLQPRTPPALDRLIMTCLAKSPDDRWQSSVDLVRELRWIGERGSEATASTHAVAKVPLWQVPNLRMALIPGLLVAGAAIGAIAVALLGGPHQGPRVSAGSSTALRFDIALPSGDKLVTMDNHGAGPSLDVSPDGSKLVYVAQHNGRTQLMLRRFDQLEPVALAGTEDALAPFFSPDGDWIGFIAEEKLKKVSAAGGAPMVLTGVPPVTRGASWAPDGSIYFSPSFSETIFKIPDSGGSLSQVTTLEPGEANHLLPHVLPGAHGVIFTVWNGGSFAEASVWVWSADTRTRHKLLDSASAARYVSSGHLVFARDNALLAVPFDLSTLKVVGSQVQVADDVHVNPTNGTAQFALSEAGALVYAPRPSAAGGKDLVWVDRQRREQRVPDLHGDFDSARLSPDGRRLAIDNLNDIWITELGTSALQRLTFTNVNQLPVWTPDGTRIAFSRPGPGGTTPSLFWVATDSGSQPEQLTSGADAVDFPSDWSPDGLELAFARSAPFRGNWDILTWNRQTRQTSFVEHSQFNEVQPAFSPDGHWLAYVSDLSGRYEVYVRPYPGSGARLQVSSDGGTIPRWSPDGSELFYVNGNAMMRVAIRTSPTLSASKAELVFEGEYEHNIGSPGFANYSVSKDGQRFLMIKPVDAGAGLNKLTVVLGGVDAWRRRAQ